MFQKGDIHGRVSFTDLKILWRTVLVVLKGENAY